MNTSKRLGLSELQILNSVSNTAISPTLTAGHIARSGELDLMPPSKQVHNSNVEFQHRFLYYCVSLDIFLLSYSARRLWPRPVANIGDTRRFFGNNRIRLRWPQQPTHANASHQPTMPTIPLGTPFAGHSTPKRYRIISQPCPKMTRMFDRNVPTVHHASSEFILHGQRRLTRAIRLTYMRYCCTCTTKDE